jgi:TetR/AcrR family transcriptional regulator, regulator of cefoperazone and chloramphenicol sensitivity
MNSGYDHNQLISANNDDAKTHLLVVGLQIFGLYGFEGVRTRTLAETAKVNQSAIPYYFGGKKGLYLAVAHYLSNFIRDKFLETALQKAGNITEMSKTEAADLLKTIITQFAKTMIGNHDDNARSAFIAREQLQPTEAYDILYEKFFQPFHQLISSVVGRLIDLDERNPQTIMIAHAIIGQALSFAIAKETYLRRQGIRDLDEAHINHIAQMLGQLSLRICGITENILD